MSPIKTSRRPCHRSCRPGAGHYERILWHVSSPFLFLGSPCLSATCGSDSDRCYRGRVVDPSQAWFRGGRERAKHADRQTRSRDFNEAGLFRFPPSGCPYELHRKHGRFQEVVISNIRGSVDSIVDRTVFGSRRGQAGVTVEANTTRSTR